ARGCAPERADPACRRTPAGAAAAARRARPAPERGAARRPRQRRGADRPASCRRGTRPPRGPGSPGAPPPPEPLRRSPGPVHAARPRRLARRGRRRHAAPARRPCRRTPDRHRRGAWMNAAIAESLADERIGAVSEEEAATEAARWDEVELEVDEAELDGIR